ncbi:diacylglycerol kinase family protein [Komagataeibacter rhaeticus]|nr:diacylglycerol kinase family protein [Komagataeibacter rhaeticus]
MDCIVIDGGDGTVSDVLSAVHRHYAPDRLPAIAVLPSGNTNLIAGMWALACVAPRHWNGCSSLPCPTGCGATCAGAAGWWCNGPIAMAGPGRGHVSRGGGLHARHRTGPPARNPEQLFP